MQKIYHKRNELLEVEFFKDYDCKIPFDFTNVKDLYIELKAGDITPFLQLYPYTEFRNLYLPCFPNVAAVDFLPSFENIYTLDDITPNLSKYIPEDNAVIALNMNYDFCKKYFFDKNSFVQHDYWAISDGDILKEIENNVIDKSICELKKITIFFPNGTQAELQKANEVTKELKEKYGVEEVSVFMLSCFIPKNLLIKTLRPSKIDRMYDNEIYGYKMQKICNNINKIITTNSTSIFEPQDNEKLQVIDCFNIFNDSIGLITDETIIKSTNNIGGILQKLVDR